MTSDLRRTFQRGFTEWTLHAGEASGWVRLGAPFFLWVGALRRSIKQMLGVITFIAMSPYVFTPSGEDTWMNRAMRGEHFWARRGANGTASLFALGGLAAYLLSVVFGLFRKVGTSLFWLLAGTVLTGWHLDRMAAEYEEQRAAEGEEPLTQAEDVIQDVDPDESGTPDVERGPDAS